jgi:hypothetical protein
MLKFFLRSVSRFLPLDKYYELEDMLDHPKCVGILHSAIQKHRWYGRGLLLLSLMSLLLALLYMWLFISGSLPEANQVHLIWLFPVLGIFPAWASASNFAKMIQLTEFCCERNLLPPHASHKK